MTDTLDIAIIGGGLVGASLACALADSGRRVALIDASAPGASDSPSFDERNLALNRASLDALAALGVLRYLPRAPAPIRRIHISRVGDFGVVRLDAAEHGVDALGGVVIARDLGIALERRLNDLHALRRHAPASLTDMQPDPAGWRLSIAQSGESVELRTRLLVGADGTHSAVRAALGIEAERFDYGQDLFVCALKTELRPDGQAWERLSECGPVALLPRADGRFGAVCGVARDEADAVAALGDAAYCAYVQQRFGYRAGRFIAAGPRARYPLRLLKAQRLAGERAVLLGNAAQTLHPIGAQGFNLGLRDALTLAELVATVDDPGAPALLGAYAQRRATDRADTIGFSDGLARLSAAPGFAAHVLRSLGLAALGASAGLRAPLASAAMGFRHQVSRSARG